MHFVVIVDTDVESEQPVCRRSVEWCTVVCKTTVLIQSPTSTVVRLNIE